MRIAAVIVGIVIALALLWNAGEQHYQSCVQAKRLGYAATNGKDVDSLLAGGPPSVAGCSRLPF